jgi:hypothetical protein
LKQPWTNDLVGIEKNSMFWVYPINERQGQGSQGTAISLGGQILMISPERGKRYWPFEAWHAKDRFPEKGVAFDSARQSETKQKSDETKKRWVQ